MKKNLSVMAASSKVLVCHVDLVMKVKLREKKHFLKVLSRVVLSVSNCVSQRLLC